MNLHHINIKGPKVMLEKEKAFFCDILGLEAGFRPDSASKGHWLYADEKPIVHLSESDQHFTNERQGYFDHVAFQSQGLQRFVDKLMAGQVTHNIAYSVQTNMSQVFFRSPSGIRLEVNFINEKI